MALSCHSSRDSMPACDPQLILTDSLIGFVYEQLQAPDFDIGSYLNPAPINQNNTETNTETVDSYLNPAPINQNNTETNTETVDSYLNLAPRNQNNTEAKTETVDSYLNLAPINQNNTETNTETVDSYLNPAPINQNNTETKTETVDSYLNPAPINQNNTETNTETVGSYLNLAPMTQRNTKTVPETLQVLIPNFGTAASPSIPSPHQNLYCMNAQNMCHAKTGFTLNQFMQDHQMCNNHFGTASLTNQVNVLHQNTCFPVIPCASQMQGAMSYACQMQGMMVPTFKPVSTQSQAARVRRKKITDKTHELAKLIPGGTDMNTAEMLLSAFKYVSFLQAQIGILAMMDLEEAREVPIMVEEYMRMLLGSTNVQEHLSAHGKCLVPIKLAMNLTKEMKSNVVVYKDLSHFLESICNKDNASSC